MIDETKILHIIDDTAYKTLKKKLKSILKAKKENDAIVVSGDSIILITTSQKLNSLFSEIIKTISVVIACRVSPIQKAELVNMVK